MLKHLWLVPHIDPRYVEEHYEEGKYYYSKEVYVDFTDKDIFPWNLAGERFQKIIIGQCIPLKLFSILLERLYYEGEIIPADKYYSFGAVEMEVLGEGVGYIDYPTHNGKREFIRLDTLGTIDVRELYSKIDWREVGRGNYEE